MNLRGKNENQMFGLPKSMVCTGPKWKTHLNIIGLHNLLAIFL